jgi:murein L,D-transpeptidase YcbB/YkuD
MLFACQKDSLPLIMRVCTGSVTNKTPLLESDISYLNLNPIWNVPTSIAQKEVAVLQKKDPAYIGRNNMKLYKGGKEVDVDSINWKEVNPSKFTYTIRQNSGERNALGLIKFMFNNAFSVYLHDTPSKAAFNRKNRAVSHGCVRVQKPFDLAFFCMSATSDNAYKDRLYYSIDKSPVSNEGKKLARENKLKKLPDILNPKSKISLSIDYYTAYMYPDDNDTLYYADDVYDYDNIILNALDSNDVKRDEKTAKSI